MAAKFNPKGTINAAKKVIAKRMKGAMLLVQGEVQRKINIAPDKGTRRVASGKTAGTIVARNPAKLAPTPPRKVSGALSKSITHDVVIEPREVIGRVGSNLVYARRLEKGFFGADKRGRNFNQKPRPYLRPALTENIKRVVAKLGGA